MKLQSAPQRASSAPNHLGLAHMLACPCLLRGSTLLARLPDREVRLQAPAAVLASIYDFDGELTPESWLEQHASRGWDAAPLLGFLDCLIREGILIATSAQPHYLWSHARNPVRGAEHDVRYTQEWVEEAQTRLAAPRRHNLRVRVPAHPLLDLLASRQTVRDFSVAAIELDRLSAILWAACGRIQRDGRIATLAPSAGALYPLQCHLINLRPTGALDRGAYSVAGDTDGNLCYAAHEADLSLVPAAFQSPALLDQAQAVLLISADLGLSARKYAARALTYAPLEAGHLAQNVLLSAQAQGCAAAEIGGFSEDVLQALLQLPAHQVPLISIVLGMPGASGNRMEFEWIQAGRDVPRLHLCRARQQSDHPWSWGRDADPARARLKAEMESRERAALLRPRHLIQASLEELPNAIPPGEILRYSSSQYRRPGFAYRPFEEKASYWWQPATDHFDAKDVHVLADLIYLEAALANYPRPAPYTSANTSGTASHTVAVQALENAVLELLERDAFMRFWINNSARRAPHGQRVRRRLQELRDNGIEVHVLDIGQNYCPVALCFAQSKARHLTRVTTACHYDWDVALEHALQELESQIGVDLLQADPPALRPRDVQEAGDHARLYAQPAHFQKADHIKTAGLTLPPLEHAASGWSSLTDRLAQQGQRLITVDLTTSAPDNFPTWRAFMPGLLMLKFGHGNLPLGHPAFRNAPARCRFPHPLN